MMMHRIHAGISRWLAAGYDWVSQPARALPTAVATGLLALGQLPAQAQFPINETFTTASTSAFTLGGNAALTGTNTTPGYLRLTDATGNQAGYAVLNSSFASAKGFSISFEFFSYGGNSVAPADGISVFLIDANGTDPKASPSQFSIGAYGGSLGYAQKTAASGATTTDINGVVKGYLGIGLDEYGNYATSSEGRSGGYSTASGGTTNTSTLVPQSVTLRGPGTGISGYPYLTSSGTLPFNLSVGTARAQSTSADYRKAYIYVVPVNGNFQVTVRIQHGATITTTTDSYVVSTPPANLRIGFAGSTGAYVNVHEIRNLSILDNPYAQDDNAITRYGTPINLSVLDNDRGLGAALAPGTVDLDPNTAGIQSTYSVAGGTFSVNNQGVVTFTPAAGFAGSVSIPYVVSDILGKVSNQAIITVGVTGADVATGISGPASVSPGGQVSYVVSTLNNGSEVATNVTPTLQLPAGLSISASADYTYNATSGLVTFNPVTLGAGGATSNTISFNAPNSGSIAATASYTYPAGAAVPDAVSSNNSAALTTTVSGAANVASSCSIPGKDGPATLTSTSTPNTYYPGVSVTTTDDNSVITVGAASGSTTAVAVGDLVLVMQMQGAAMTTTATSTSYGVVSSSTAGQYEYALVASVSGTPVSSITLTQPLTNTYQANASQSQHFQLVRVPQYSALTVNGVVTGLAWNSVSKVGGVLALDVAGTITFSGTTPGLSMTAKGFAGGGGVSYAGNATNNQSLYATPTTVTAHGSKGEGIAGTPKNFYNGTAVQTTGAGYATGDNNRGAPATGGGGAQDNIPTSNTGNSGGGGGSNVAAGGTGGYGSGSNSTGNRAGGGYAVAGSATRLLLGGGGGAGSFNSNTLAASNSSGGVGGGIIILRTGKAAGSAATLQANGGNAPTGGTQGGGGGGAGGTVLVLATPTPSTDASGLNQLTVRANGGAGATVNNNLFATSYGPGGGGGGGAVYANGALSASSAAAGASGVTSNGNSFGATAGTAGTTSATTAAASTNTIGGAGSCLPMLSVALSTTTPTVRRTNGTPNPATFVAVISNVGGQAQSTSTTLAMDPLFTYDNTFAPVVTVTTADGGVSTLPAGSYTVTGTSSPVLSGPSIPSGATLRLTYRATIAASAITGTAYQASGTVAFADPTRSAATTTATPGGTFTNGGPVPGTNYAAASSTLEDVTVVAPLPVELVRFEASAVRQAALLTWTTATEHDNDHFTVERSRTGHDFTAVGTVRGQGTRLQPTNYTFTDDEAGRLGAGLVYYRLRQVDTDGTPTYSPVRTVRFAASAQGTPSLYPNPNAGLTTLDLSSLASGTYAVQVFDLAGRLLRTENTSAQVLSLNLTELPQGAYLVVVQGENYRQSLPLLRN